MPITGPIPLPKSSMDSYLQGQDAMSQMLSRLRQRQASEAEQQRMAQMQPYDIALKQAQIKQTNARSDLPFGGQSLPGPAGQIMALEALKSKFGENSPQYKDAYQSYKSQQDWTQNRGLGAGGREQQFYLKQVAMDNPQLKNDPVKLYEASNVLAKGGNTLSDGTQLNPLSKSSRDSLDRITKYGNTTQGLNQQRYANTAENLIQSADKNAQGAVQYSGLLGGAGGSIQKVEQLLGGKNSPQYQQYINFTRNDVPTLAGEFMRELGVNASDEQKRMYKEVVNPINWDTNPQAALARWNYFKETVKTVGKSISQSPSEIRSNLSNPKQNSNNEELVSIKNPKTGEYKKVTRKEAKEKYGVQNV